MLSALLMFAAAAHQPDVRALLPKDDAAPGCALDVRRDGTAVETIAVGLANLENVTRIHADTVFEIGSVSKQFIGAGIAILAADGRLSLDDPIVKWLPELPPLYRGITIAMLVHHTSGIRSWQNLAELTGRDEDGTGYDNAWVLRAVARQQQLNNAPGAEYLYSNSNFVLAATVIERASGQPLNDFYRDALFQRLGMTRTRWRTDFREIVPNRAQAYRPSETGGWRLDMPFNGVAGAGALLSTVGDLQKWNAVLQNPTPRDRGWVAALLRPGTLSDGTELRYGMGIELAPIAGRAAFSHAGSTASYRAWLGLFPAERLSVVLLCNSGALNTEDLGEEIAARYLPPLPAAPAATQSKVTVPAKLAGLYRNLANDSAVEAKADAAGLHLNGGPGFGLVAPQRLATADGRRSAIVAQTADGGQRLTVTRVGNAPTMLERVAPWKPAQGELRQLAGTYASAEIDGVQTIEPQGDALIWRDPSGIAHPLVPLYTGAFDAPDASWTLRFHKQHGTMMLDMSITRARRIVFRRTAPPNPTAVQAVR